MGATVGSSVEGEVVGSTEGEVDGSSLEGEIDGTTDGNPQENKPL